MAKMQVIHHGNKPMKRSLALPAGIVLGNIVLLAMRTTFRVRLEYIGHFR
jgi:hypothetical protein